MGKKRRYFKNKKRQKQSFRSKILNKGIEFAFGFIFSNAIFSTMNKEVNSEKPVPGTKQLDNIQDIDHEVVSTKLNDNDKA